MTEHRHHHGEADDFAARTMAVMNRRGREDSPLKSMMMNLRSSNDCMTNPIVMSFG
jgi:hypothetical protein